MEYTLKIHSAPILVERDNPFKPGEKRLVQRVLYHGGRVSTDADGDDPNVTYGLREYDELKLTHLGAFFSEGEQAAFEAGATDDLSEEPDAARLGAPRGDSSLSPAFGRPAGDSTEAHPLSFGEMTVEQFAAQIASDAMSVEDLLQALSENPHQEMATKILNAENMATGSEPREGLAEGIAEILGYRTGAAPEGSEGVEGTIPEGLESEGDKTEATQGNGGGDGGESEPNATDNAKEYAASKDIDLSKVTGTLDNGKISKTDVEKYEAENQ